METTLRYGGDYKSLRIHAKEKFPISSNSICQLNGVIDTKAGTPTYGNAMIRYFYPENTQRAKTNVVVSPLPVSRRAAFLISVLPLSLVAIPQTLLARERRTRKTIPIEDYLTSSDGLKYYDIVEGKGPIAEKGSTVQVHFDCLYRGITAVSSRESKLLAGNRSIAQPYEFQVGAIPGKERKREFVDNPNGLFSAQAAPKPPKALYTITEGMKVGGKRTVIIPPEAGYGSKGMNEIPPNAEFEMNIELLQVSPKAS